MKILSKTFKLLAVCFLAFNLTACDEDDVIVIPEQSSNIVELALATPDLSTLVAALQAADGDLVSVLSGDGPFTVLAPTNEAFSTFLSENNFNSLDEVPTDVLSQILLNHVISADVSSSDLISAGSGYTSSNADGAAGQKLSLYYNTSNGVRFNNVASVTEGGADIDASNGTVHIIDAVIGLPNIVDHATANPGFSNLVAALGAADGDLVSVLNGAGPFTVLAPDNDAFATFLNGDQLSDVPTDVLAQVLLNHVLTGSTLSTDLVSAGAGYTSTNASGPGSSNLSLYYNTTSGVVFNGISNVVQADVVTTNGIIHAVDTVIDIPTVVTFALADPNFSTLVTALTDLTPATDFAGILSRTEGMNSDGINPEFTVFAPTNDAFAAVDPIPGEDDLTQILLHHVIGGANIRSGDLTDGVSPTMLNGQTITINLPGTGNNIADITDGAGNTGIGIDVVDVQAGNGVIHAVDTVLLPGE